MAAISHVCQEALFFISGGLTQCAETSSDNSNAEPLLNYQSPFVKKKIGTPKKVNGAAWGHTNLPSPWTSLKTPITCSSLNRHLGIGSAPSEGAELHFLPSHFRGSGQTDHWIAACDRDDVATRTEPSPPRLPNVVVAPGSATLQPVVVKCLNILFGDIFIVVLKTTISVLLASPILVVIALLVMLAVSIVGAVLLVGAK